MFVYKVDNFLASGPRLPVVTLHAKAHYGFAPILGHPCLFQLVQVSLCFHS